MFALLIPMAHIVNSGQISYNFQIHFRHFGLDAWAQFEKPCANGTKLLILTMSRREGFDSRRGIRTWMKDALAGEELRFLIAGPGKDEADDVQQQLVNEQKEHGDLVLMHGFVDVYAHLHIKMYSGFVWQQRHCAGAEWVLKVDDDIAVHLRHTNSNPFSAE
ncbi:hypothetical protein niasHS_007945 [Heterodera schachtii]|uniref:Hexosyltransferase n=1 Tax=Heterodera schachtii TaxID=97005 RepID=A0ABD2JQ49_HETSC